MKRQGQGGNSVSIMSQGILLARYTAYLLNGKFLVGLDTDLTGLLHRLLLDERHL